MNPPCPTPSTPLRPPVLANANFNGPCIQPYYSPPPSTRKRKHHDENVFTAPGLTQHSPAGMQLVSAVFSKEDRRTPLVRSSTCGMHILTETWRMTRTRLPSCI